MNVRSGVRIAAESGITQSVKKSHGITLALLLCLSALLSRHQETAFHPGDGFSVNDFSFPRRTFGRESLEGFTINGVTPGEDLQAVVKRHGKPILCEGPLPLCIMNYTYWYGSENHGLHITGLNRVESVEGDSLELSGTTLATGGDARTAILKELGQPEQSIGDPGQTLGYDTYWPEGISLGYRQGKLERIWATACREVPCYDGNLCCSPQLTYDPADPRKRH